METYWCCKNNSIIDNYLKPDFNHALVPYIKEKCPRWKEWEGSGGCILVVKQIQILSIRKKIPAYSFVPGVCVFSGPQ